MRPWETASRKLIKQWIRDVALSAEVFGDYDTWINSMMEELGWSKEDCDEFLKIFHNRILTASRYLDDWLSGVA